MKLGGLFAGGPKVIATTRNACATEDALWDFDFPPQQSISLSLVSLIYKLIHFSGFFYIFLTY